MVSIQTTSAPPSLRPSICSTKTSTASSSVSGPSGAKRSPVGPTEPATTTGRPAASATARAFSAASRFSSRVRVLEIVQHQAPAVGAEGIGEDDVGAGIDEALVERADASRGWVSFHSSGESPEVSPMSKRLVPVAPSARRTGFAARRDSSEVRMALRPCRAATYAKRIAPETSVRDRQCSSSSDSVTASDGTSSGTRRSLGGRSSDRAVAGRRRVAVDAGLQRHGVDDPELGDAEAGVELGLAAKVVGEAGIGDLDHELRRAGGSVPPSHQPWDRRRSRARDRCLR